MFKAFEKIIEVAREKNVDYVFHGGDIFNRSNPQKKTIIRAYRLIEDLLRDNIGFIVSPGNHERSKLPNTLLQYHEKCHIFSKLEIVDLNDDYKLIGFPFYNDAVIKIIPELEKLSTKFRNKSLIILCHQLFDGVEFGPHRFTFGLAHGAIDPLVLPLNINLVITGHIHKAQSLQKGLIVYPGSTERTSFVEVIEPKGYLLIDLLSDSIVVSFQQLETIPMDVLEINLEKETFDIIELKKSILKGNVRTLLRFTGRSLSRLELSQLDTNFNAFDYPLLTITPSYEMQKLKSLFGDNYPSFSFRPIFRKKVI